MRTTNKVFFDRYTKAVKCLEIAQKAEAEFKFVLSALKLDIKKINRARLEGLHLVGGTMRSLRVVYMDFLLSRSKRI